MTAQAAARLKAFVSVVLPIVVTLGGFAAFIFVRTEARADAGERKVDAVRHELREVDAGWRVEVRQMRRETREDLKAAREEMRAVRDEIMLELRRRR
ncbi:MAG: hypothetical protein ABT940_10860 [Alphaproteobacteria bacterium]